MYLFINTIFNLLKSQFIIIKAKVYLVRSESRVHLKHRLML